MGQRKNIKTNHLGKILYETNAGFLRSLEKYEKSWSFSSLENSGKKFLVCWHGNRKYFSRLDLLTYILIIFCSDTFDKIDNFTFNV